MKPNNDGAGWMCSRWAESSWTARVPFCNALSLAVFGLCRAEPVLEAIPDPKKNSDLMEVRYSSKNVYLNPCFVDVFKYFGIIMVYYTLFCMLFHSKLWIFNGIQYYYLSILKCKCNWYTLLFTLVTLSSLLYRIYWCTCENMRCVQKQVWYMAKTN